MKTTASTLALAFTASLTLFSTTGATWPVMQQAASQAAPNVNVAPLPDTSYSETPAWAERFVDSIGVDASFEDRKYPARVTQELLASGIRHLRESGPPSPTFIALMKFFGQHGIRHSVGMGYGFSPADLRSRLNAFAPYVDFVEPANEADNVKHPNWGQIRSDQKNLWNTVRSNRAWDNITVLGPSFANPKDHAKFVGPLDKYEDAGALHNSTCNWNPGTDIVWVSIDVNTARARETTQYKPLWTTENGYSDNQARGCNLTDDQIARYLPRTSTERWLHGEARTYFDVLTDDPHNVVFGKLGLLHANGTPKPQMIALDNLIHLLADPGAAPRSTHVSYSISGATADVHHILLARRDGTYDLVIYREVPCYDHFGHVRIDVPSDSVSITVPGMKHAALYKYNAQYSFATSSLAVGSNHQTTRFPVTDMISVLHFGF